MLSKWASVLCYSLLLRYAVDTCEKNAIKIYYGSKSNWYLSPEMLDSVDHPDAMTTISKKSSSAFWYFAQKDSFFLTCIQMEKNLEVIKPAPLYLIVFLGLMNGWSYCYLTKATLFTVRTSYSEQQCLFTIEYSGREDVLSVWLVLLKKKKKKIISERQHH